MDKEVDMILLKVRKGASINRIGVESVAEDFMRQGFDVYIRNGDGIILAVTGPGCEKICCLTNRKLIGFEQIRGGDEFFSENGHEFVDARDFFRE